MSKFDVRAVAVAISLASMSGAFAQGMSKDEYGAAKDKIATDYTASKAACDPLAGGAKDVCLVEARGKQRVALADLTAGFKPSPKNQYRAQVAAAERDYAVAAERCEDSAGQTRHLCKKDAKAAEKAAIAEAVAQRKTAKADARADEKTADARKEASEESAEARKEALEAKTEAQYAAAKERCDIYAGSTKEQCLERARTSYGKL